MPARTRSTIRFLSNSATAPDRRPRLQRCSQRAVILRYVSGNKDKRRRGDLDLFVLAFIDSGISTPYELKSAANLSPGATIPALRRLVNDRLAIQAKPGPRGRTDHKITAEGRRRLKEGWRQLIEQGSSGDLDADLRVALLALWIGHDRRLAVSFLRQAADERLNSANRTNSQDERASLPALALWYRQLRSIAAGALTKGESAAALAMAKALPRSARAKAGRSRAKTTP